MVKDINNLYFTDEEYDIFAEKYQNERTTYVENIRKQVQDKLLDLNEAIKKRLQEEKLEVFNHINPKNTTSLIFPCWYNKGRVNWLGVRYGKHPADITALNKIVGTRNNKEPKYAFQKHACMQINVGYNGVEIGIFHAVPNDAIDRSYLHEHIRNNDVELLNAVKEQINSIRYYGYEWTLWDTSLEGVDVPDYGGINAAEKVYKFDNENVDDFLEWYDKNDRDGCYSSLLVHFPRYDERVNANNIVETTIGIFKQLYPLYKLISWNIHYTGKVEI